MTGETTKCTHKYINTMRACPHPHSKDGLCIFHREDAEAKSGEFIPALEALIQKVEADDSIERYDFVGFIFPEAGLTKKIFTKSADFRNSQFSEYAYFRNSQFSGDADFSYSQFSGGANFMGSQFSGGAAFMYSQFSGHADFRDSQFSGDAYFIHSQFSGDAVFIDSQFSGGAYFSYSQFSGGTDFRDSQFKQRAEFAQARFHSEIHFEDSRIAFLKSLNSQNAQPLNFRGMVLEAAHLWDINRLENQDFTGAFLLSLSLAGKEIIDCNFTGAVFDAVHTRGWQPDEKTLANTRYIYTDYEEIVETDPGDENATRKVYRAIEESRVPADGDFYDKGGDNHFTLADYLKDPIKWSLTPNVPPQVRNAVASYFTFFSDFMKVTQGVKVEIRTRQEGKKIRVEFFTDSETDREKVKEHFKTYRDNLKEEDTEHLDIRFDNDKATQLEKDLLEIKYKNQITNLRTELSYTQRLLSSEQEKVQILKMQQNPQSMLPPPVETDDRNIFIMNADMAGFTKAVQANPAINQEMPRFLFEQERAIKLRSGHQRTKLEGDCIKTFFEDGTELVWVAEDLIAATKCQ